MTTSELAARLAAMPPDLDVYVRDPAAPLTDSTLGHARVEGCVQFGDLALIVVTGGDDPDAPLARR